MSSLWGHCSQRRSWALVDAGSGFSGLGHALTLSATLLNKPVPGGCLLMQVLALRLERGPAISLTLDQADRLRWGAWECVWGGSCDGWLKCWGVGAGGVICGCVMVHLLANYVSVCQFD